MQSNAKLACRPRPEKASKALEGPPFFGAVGLGLRVQGLGLRV